jgi:hypothetical protein
VELWQYDATDLRAPHPPDKPGARSRRSPRPAHKVNPAINSVACRGRGAAAETADASAKAATLPPARAGDDWVNVDQAGLPTDGVMPPGVSRQEDGRSSPISAHGTIIVGRTNAPASDASSPTTRAGRTLNPRDPQ